MNPHYLDFEQPIADLDSKIDELRHLSAESGINIAEEVARLQAKSKTLTEKIFSDLSIWQKVQLARHPKRPYTLEYVRNLIEGFDELHGDRLFGDDQALVGGLGEFRGRPVMVIGHEKGRSVKEKVARNFGMPRPEGYRKSQRLMQMAERFRIPVLTFIDTPGAYPGIGAEQRGQASAIANSIECCMSLKVPNISIIIGEGGSGGAIALASSNKVIMLENSIYSVISPEGCASILWRDPSKSLQAAEAMKLTAKDLLNLKIIDEVIPEPLGGAHRDPESIAADIKHSIIKHLKNFENYGRDEIYDHRKSKFLQIGRDQGFNKSSNVSEKGLSYNESEITKLKSHLVKNKFIYLGFGLVAITALIAILS